MPALAIKSVGRLVNVIVGKEVDSDEAKEDDEETEEDDESEGEVFWAMKGEFRLDTLFKRFRFSR